MSADQAESNNPEDLEGAGVDIESESNTDSDSESGTDTQAQTKELEQKHRSIRDLGRREISFLKKLRSDYPGFSALSAGDQLDRMILVLQSACGYGAVSKRIVGQIQEQLGWQLEFDVEGHFRESQYDSAETGIVQTRYRESFERGFCLKREFMHILANEGESETKNEPIRKTVPKKASSAPAPTKPTAKTSTSSKPAARSQAKPQKPEPVLQKTEPALAEKAEETPSVQQVEPQANINQPKQEEATQATSDESQFKPWMIFASAGLLIVIVALAFLI